MHLRNAELHSFSSMPYLHSSARPRIECHLGFQFPRECIPWIVCKRVCDSLLHFREPSSELSRLGLRFKSKQLAFRLLGIVDGSVAFRRTRPRVVGASRIASLSLKTHEANPLRSHYDGQAEEHLHQMAHAMGRSWYSSRGGRGSVDEVCLMFVTRSPDVAPAAFTKHLRQELSFPEIGPKNVQTPGQNTQVSVQGDYRDHDGRFQHIQNRHQG